MLLFSFLLFVQNVFAHELQHYGLTLYGYNWYTPGSTTTVNMDPCTNSGLASFRVVSEQSAYVYLRDGDPLIGPYVWDISVQLYDATTGQTIKVYTNANIPAGSETQIDNELTSLDLQSTDFEYTNDHKMIYYFNDIEVYDGHTYQIHFSIINEDLGLPFNNTTQTSAWTNSVVVNGSFSSLGGWYHKQVDPSFTSVSTGDITGVDLGSQNEFFIGSDNRVYNIVHANGQYNIWCLDWNFTQAAPGSLVASQYDGDVFFTGTDGRVYHCRWENNQWNIWCLDWNFTQAAPGAITVNSSNGDVFLIGTDGRLYQCRWENNQWNTWCLDWNFTQAAPGAITVNSSNGDVYFIGTDSRVYHAKWLNNQWNVWPIDWNFNYAAPGAITVDESSGDVFVTGTDNRLYHCRWWNNQWNVWCLDWNFTQVAPGALACQKDNGHVRFIGTDNKLYHAVWDNNQWNMWGIDNNYTATQGALGVHWKNFGNKKHDMILSRDNQGRLNIHYWISCANAKPGKTDPDKEMEQKIAYYKANKEQYLNSNSLAATLSASEQSELMVQPNPVVGDATISFYTDKNETVTLSVFDITGSKVREILNSKTLQEGRHSYQFSKEELVPGMYIVTLQTSEKNITQKFIIQ